MIVSMLYVFLLFVVLTPGVLLKLPSAKSSPLTLALVHGLVFVTVYHFSFHVHSPLSQLLKQ